MNWHGASGVKVWVPSAQLQVFLQYNSLFYRHKSLDGPERFLSDEQATSWVECNLANRSITDSVSHLLFLVRAPHPFAKT